MHVPVGIAVAIPCPAGARIPVSVLLLRNTGRVTRATVAGGVLVVVGVWAVC